MRWIVLALILIVNCATALRMTNTRVGSYVIWLLYDEDQPVSNPVIATRIVSPTPTTSGGIWLVRVTDNATNVAVVNATIGQSVFSSRILTGPNACDNLDPAKRIINVNCATSSIQTLINRDQLQASWPFEFYGPNGELCLLSGGDEMTCLGKIRWIRPNVDTFVVSDNPSKYDVLFSQYAALECAMGPHANFPCIFQIDTIGSQLVVTTDLFDSPCFYPPNSARTFEGTYNPFPYDAYSGYFLTVGWSFEKQTSLTQLRVLFRRTSVTSEEFWVEFADSSGDRASDYFRVFWRSNFTVASPLERTFPNFVGRILTFSNPENSTQTCQAFFEVTEPPTTPVLIPKPVTTINNYVFQQNSPLYRASMFEVGSLDENGFLTVPNCAAEQMCRCVDASRLSSNGKRMNMTAWVPFQDYTLRCSGYYSRATFNSFGTTGSNGPEVRTDQPESALCNAPFLVPENILSLNNPQERAFQCALRHMFVSASTGHCSQVVSRSFCRLGTFPYDYRCWVKYNFEVQKQLRGPILSAQKACDSIFPDFPPNTMTPISPSDPNFIAWLSEQLEDPCDPNVIVRIVNSASNCYCYRCVASDFGPPTIVDDPCLCDGNFFAPCNYPFEAYEVINQWQSWSPNMIAYMKNGEPDGVPFDGTLTRCDPAVGSVGSRGETATVPAPTDFTTFQVGNQMTTTNSVFYAVCYALGRGSAYQYQPLTCYCNPYYGPIATMSSTNNTAFRAFPCRCPASSTISSGSFKINGVIYSADGVSYDVCDTLDSGECLVNTFSGNGVCSCASSLPLNDDSPFATEPIKGGDACTCFRPQVPADGRQNTIPIVQTVCNAQGICCGGSGGEGIDERCFDATTGANKKGCVCTTNGVGGEACTCSAPRNLLFGSPVLVAPGFAYSKMTVESFVGVVYLQTRRSGYYLGGFAGCNVTQVSLTNNPFSSDVVNCTLVIENTVRKWLCPTTQQWFFVVAYTLESAPRCLMQAYEQDVPVGGPVNNTNKFAGRMFAIKELRQYGLYYRQQQVVFSSNGCTHYGDMCNANFDGAGCLAGVSSIRLYDSAQVVMVCSASTTVGGGEYAGYIVRNPVTGFQQCECNAFTASAGNNGPQNPGVMVGNACQCASYYVQERGERLDCGGHGPCVQPSFALGFCELTLERYLADPLAQPFVDIGGQIQNQYQQVFYNRQPSVFDNGAGDLRSVIAVIRNGTRQSWFVSPQQIFFLQGVSGDVGQHCGRNVRDTLPIQFVDSPNALAPERAEAVVTFWYANGTVATETCDPAKLVAEPGACTARVYCLPAWVAAGSINTTEIGNYAMSPCIAQQIWQSAGSSDILAECQVTVDFLCSRALSIESNSVTITSAQYPPWGCNVAFDRVLDWMSCMDRCDEDYTLQCANATMGYNDFDLGVAFGLYYNQIFNCPFADDYLEWTECNFRLIATTMNSERCFFTSDNTTVQLMNDGRLYDYIFTWASRVIGVEQSINTTLFFDGLDLNRTILNFTVRPTATNTAFVTFNYDILYERTLGYLDASEYDYSPQLLELCVQFYWWAVKTIELYQTSGPSVTLDPQLQTYGADVPWFVLDSLKRGYIDNARPGVWQYIVGIDPANLIYLNVTFPQALDLAVVFTPTNELCAVTFHVEAGESRLLTCDFADTSEARNWFGTSQQLFDAVMDVAEQMIGAHASDLAFSSTELYETMMQFFQAHSMDGANGFKLWMVPTNFLYVLNGTNASLVFATADPQFLQQKQIPPQPNFQSYYATVVPVVTRNDWVEQWNNMSFNLYVNHESPSNPIWAADKTALANQGTSIWCRAIDLGNAEDQKYLADLWYTYYAPFRCSQSNACKTTSRSHGDRCVFDARLYQPWYNRDPDVTYNGVGNEGGCKNWQTPSNGFYDRVRFGQSCTSGYGPYTVNEFTDVQDFQDAIVARYSLSYYPIFDPSAYPFNQYVGPSSSEFVDQLDDYLSCRLPWNLAQRGKLCSGRGTVNVYNTTATVQITTYALIAAGINLNTRVFPRCNSIEFLDGSYALGPVFNARNLVYASGLNRISVLDESVWFTNGTAGTIETLELECTSDLVWTCSTALGTMTCSNLVLYDPTKPNDAMQIVGFDVKSYTTFLVTLTDADE